MIKGILGAALTIVTYLSIMSGEASAQVYLFEGNPYGNANFGTTVIDQVVYQAVGNGVWQQKSQVVRATDKAVLQGYRVTGQFREVSRGGGEVQLQSAQSVPVKLTDNGTYLFRTYPEVPVPAGINPNEKRWWRMKGTGRWTSNRPQ